MERIGEKMSVRTILFLRRNESSRIRNTRWANTILCATLALVGMLFMATCTDTGGQPADDPAVNNTIDTIAPGRVENVIVTVEESELVLTWEDPADRDLDYILIDYALTTEEEDAEQSIKVDSATERASIGELLSEMVYAITITSIDYAGNYSKEYKVIVKLPDSSAPGNLGALVVTPLEISGSIKVAWTDPADTDLVRVDITWAPSGEEGRLTTPQTVSILPGIQEAIFDNLTVGTEYTFVLTGIDDVGNQSEDQTISFAPPDVTPPDPPSNIMLVSQRNGDVILTWTDPIAEDVVDILINWSSPTATGPLKPSLTVPGAQLLFIGGLRIGSQYTFELWSVDASGNQSEIAMTATPVAPSLGIESRPRVSYDTTDGPSDLVAGDEFGGAIADIGDMDGSAGAVTVLAIGAPGVDAAAPDTGRGLDRGAIYLLSLDAGGALIETTRIDDSTTNGPNLENYDSFGSSIVSAGDLNGDEGTVIIVGDDNETLHLLSFNSAGALQSTVEVHSNSHTNGPRDIPASSSFGLALANAGDLYGTGGTVIAVGAAGIRHEVVGPATEMGTIYLLSFDQSGVLQSTTEIYGSPQLPGVASGKSLATLDDLYGTGGTVLAVGTGRLVGADPDYEKRNPGASLYTNGVHLVAFDDSGAWTSTTNINGSTPRAPNLGNATEFAASLANVGDLYLNGGTVLASSIRTIGSNKKGGIYLLSFSASGALRGSALVTHEMNGGPMLHDDAYFGTSIASLKEIRNILFVAGITNGDPDIAREDGIGGFYMLGR